MTPAVGTHIRVNMARGYLGLAWVYISGYRWGWTDLDRNEALARANTLKRRSNWLSFLKTSSAAETLAFSVDAG